MENKSNETKTFLSSSTQNYELKHYDCNQLQLISENFRLNKHNELIKLKMHIKYENKVLFNINIDKSNVITLKHIFDEITDFMNKNKHNLIQISERDSFFKIFQMNEVIKYAINDLIKQIIILQITKSRTKIDNKEIREELIKNIHLNNEFGTHIPGHLMEYCLSKSYIWPRMGRNCIQYVKTCKLCNKSTEI